MSTHSFIHPSIYWYITIINSSTHSCTTYLPTIHPTTDPSTHPTIQPTSFTLLIHSHSHSLNWLSIHCWYIHPAIYPPIQLFTHNLPIIHPSNIHPPTHPSFYLPIQTSIHLPIHPFIYPSDHSLTHHSIIHPLIQPNPTLTHLPIHPYIHSPTYHHPFIYLLVSIAIYTAIYLFTLIHHLNIYPSTIQQSI